MSGWIQLRMTLGRLDPAATEDALTAAGAVAVTFEDDADDPIYEPAPGEAPLWPETRITALFNGGIAHEALRALVAGALHLETLPPHAFVELGERDWADAWLRDFKPMCFGDSLWVIPGGQTPPDPAACNILLDPGLAFGTGTHATTALCLEWLEADRDLAGTRVIDYGCGSGILAIAAVRLGASAVLAVDNDPQALYATRENAARNEVASRILVCAPNDIPDDWRGERLVANILSGPLVALAGRFRSLLAGGGRFALSGLIESQTDEIAGAYTGWCRLAPPVIKEGWVRIDGHKVD